MAQPTSLGRALWSPSALALAPRRPPAKTFPVLKPPARPRPPAPRRHTTYSYLQARQSPEMVRDEPLDFENEDDPLIPTRRPAKRYTDPPAPLFSPSPPLPSPPLSVPIGRGRSHADGDVRLDAVLLGARRWSNRAVRQVSTPPPSSSCCALGFYCPAE